MPGKIRKGVQPAPVVAWEDVEKPSYDIIALCEQFRRRLVKADRVVAPLQNGAAKTKQRQGRKR